MWKKIIPHRGPTFTRSGKGKGHRSRACIYKGKIYSQGDHWTDGCEYNCTCVDETTGRYNCVNLCATFTNLPQGCTLVKKPGECCALPDCGNYTLPGSGQGSGFCYYKGQMHGQGEQWNDGCDYKCTCQDATTGTYRCTDRCYKWNLPAGLCTLDPAPAGKCCPVPNCSSQVVLQYPPGYVQE
ncbi:kielin/chordin-like protein [Pecten maximus]|uniref:kielin/chordin-like protein n=1 Tax=Pecten maximus TaxID=6579 RepID=UPI0014581B2D|nr:kielin/chordin-like protein [Pecten maximus]